MLPKVARSINKSHSNMGGWLTGLSNDLLLNNKTNLTVAFPNIDGNINGTVDGMNYYGFKKGDVGTFEKIISKEAPDIIHIFGTEYQHSLMMVIACENLGIVNKVIVNIQGLIGFISQHYLSGIPSHFIYKKTIRDIIKNDSIAKQQSAFIARGEHENKLLTKVRHVIGRTEWDKACVKSVNKDLEYHFCNETLRDSFYKFTWNFNKCDRYSIFVSQASYPIKGFHFILESLAHIKRRFPSTILYVTDISPLEKSFVEKLKINSYQNYIGKLIKKYKLEDNVVYLGSLNEVDMCERYLKSNVFVSGSTIENSPNSVAEAMILGVPTVSSNVGGVSSMLDHHVEGYLYQHDAPYMLSHYVCKIFDNEALSVQLSNNARKRAQIAHDRKSNLNNVLRIYNNVKKQHNYN
jgi:glycosyltransferase involved in cell wall biosynthesis